MWVYHMHIVCVCGCVVIQELYNHSFQDYLSWCPILTQTYFNSKLCIVSLIITFKVATTKFISRVTMCFNQVLNPLFLSVFFPVLSPSQCQCQYWRGKEEFFKSYPLRNQGEMRTQAVLPLCLGCFGGRVERASPRAVCVWHCKSFKIINSLKWTSFLPTTRCLQSLPRRGSGTVISALEIILHIIFTMRRIISDWW